jgi:hypothetical protein
MMTSLARVLASAATAALSLAFASLEAAAQTTPPCDLVQPCRLSAGLPAATDFTATVAPNGERVVFRRFSGPFSELYSVTPGGAAPATKLSIDTVNTIHNWAISPDSTRVVYRASSPGSEVRSLYSVPIGGPASASVLLVTGDSDGVQPPPRISPDGLKVVFRPATTDQLRVVPIAGPASASARLSDPVVAGGAIFGFEISADSGSVVYQADQNTNDVVELYRVPLTLNPQPDPPTIKLNAALPAGGLVQSFRLPTVAGPVVYRADQEVAGRFELYSVSLGGNGRIKLNVPLPTGWDVPEPGSLGELDHGYNITPNGGRVVYEIETLAGAVERELYSVPIAGPASASARLDDPSTTSEEIGYLVSPSSTRVVYAVVEEVDEIDSWAYSVPIAGPSSASVQVTEAQPGGTVMTISPDGSSVIWELEDIDELFNTPIDDGLVEAVPISGDENPEATVLVNASTTRAVYTTFGFDEDVFSVPLSGTGTSYNLTESYEGSIVELFALTPHNQRAIYQGQDPGGAMHLYSSRLVPP